MVLTSEPEFTPNQGNITEMRDLVQRNRNLWNQSSSAKVTVVFFFFFFFCKVRQNDCIASMPCNFKSWPAKEITLADQKIRIWWRSYSKCNQPPAGFSVYATFDPCFLRKRETTSVGMQILTPVHFLPVFLWLTSYYFYSPCPTEGAQQGDGSFVFHRLSVISHSHFHFK